MRRFLPASIAGRTILVLLVGLTLSHAVSMAVYRNDLLTELGLSSERGTAQRVASIVRAIGEAPASDRDRTAHALSSHGVEAHWSQTPAVDEMPAPAQRADGVAERFRRLVPELARTGLRAAYADDALPDHESDRALLIAVALPDGSWANAKIVNPGVVSSSGSSHLLLSTTLMAAAIVALSIFSVRVLTAPLRSLAKAADRLGVDTTAAVPLPESGPREVRQAARAFNGMQARIKKLVADRTQMLAAISHDLRTPITRLRLRAELVEDEEVRAKMMADLADMEAMIASTLAFLRDDANKEEAKVVDVGAMLDTICNDMADAGHDVRFEGRAPAPLRCRPLAMKRALTNLVDNAVKYGGPARVRLVEGLHEVRIEVEDEGPGVPDAMREKVFSPFFRLESSRNRETGGTGLGLTVARSIVRAHGGDIELANRPTGGLRVTVMLPRIRIA